MKKYSAGNAVLVKRDIEAAGIQLKKVHAQIAAGKEELQEIERQKISAKSELQQMLDGFAPAINNIERKLYEGADSVKRMQADAEAIKNTIDKLSFYKAVLVAEVEQIEPIKFDFTEYENAVMLYNREIEQLETKAELTEAETKQLEKIRREKQAVVDSLIAKEKELIVSIEEKEAARQTIIENSDEIMREVVREKALLKEMQEKGREMAVMEYRLTDEYREVYNQTPSRSNRP